MDWSLRRKDYNHPDKFLKGLGWCIWIFNIRDLLGFETQTDLKDKMQYKSYSL